MCYCQYHAAPSLTQHHETVSTPSSLRQVVWSTHGRTLAAGVGAASRDGRGHCFLLCTACMLMPCIGCSLLSRSDIFKPLFKEDYEAFQEKERVSSGNAHSQQVNMRTMEQYPVPVQSLKQAGLRTNTPTHAHMHHITHMHPGHCGLRRVHACGQRKYRLSINKLDGAPAGMVPISPWCCLVQHGHC